MRKRTFIVIILVCGFTALALSPALAQTVTPESIQQSVSGGIVQNQRTQQEIDSALERGANAMNDLKVNKDELRWTEYQITKYAQYIEGQKARIAELERQKIAMEEIRRLLEPYLDETYKKLANFVLTDIPFAQDERRERLLGLLGDLNDPRLSIADKTGRLLDVLRAENNYGLTLNTVNTLLSLPSGEVNVRLLAVGRLGLYYQTDDGSQSGWYNKATGQWEPLTAKEGRDLTLALDIVDKKAVPALVNLPVGRP